jgi:RNA polymerase sigma factor (sigma-70 family)
VKDEPSDALLVIAACQGDHAAFGAIMRRHKGWLYRFIYRHVAGRDDAYDLLQESFISAWSALARFDPDRPFEAWLRRIALNKCRDHARRNAVRRAALAVLGLRKTQSGEDESAPTPESKAASDRALCKLETAIAALPRKFKEALVLTMLEGFSHKDAGEFLGISAKAVETRVYRAKRRLAAVLKRSDLSELIGEG